MTTNNKELQTITFSFGKICFYGGIGLSKDNIKKMMDYKGTINY